MNNQYEPGPNAPSGMTVSWGGKLGWRVTFKQTVWGQLGNVDIFRRHDPAFWDALVYAKVIVAKDSQSEAVFSAVMAG